MRPRVLIAFALLLAVLAAVPLASNAASQREVDRLADRIDRAERKVARRKGTERVLTTQISGYTRRIGRLEGRIGGLRQREDVLQSDLARQRAELAAVQRRLRAERARLARLKVRLRQARRGLAKRLVELYKAAQPDLLTVVLESQDFAELFERGEFLRRISDADRAIIGDVRAARADARTTARRLSRLEVREKALTAGILARRRQVTATKNSLISTRVGLDGTRADKRNALSKVRVDRRGLEKHVDALEAESAKIEAQLQRAAASAPGGGGGGATAGPIRRGSGNLIWPANGPISSPFGMRWGRLHAGIDVPLSVGTPLRAADSGRVAIAGWTGGYGNYTCIQHSGSLSTCYAHQSSIGVSVGQNVRQGQVIGQSGNTGNSTGPHLHFETRVNGVPQNPMGYL